MKKAFKTRLLSLLLCMLLLCPVVAKGSDANNNSDGSTFTTMDLGDHYYE